MWNKLTYEVLSNIDENRVASIKKHLVERLSSTPIGLVQIASYLDEDIQIVMIALMDLELAGIVERDFDGSFYKV